MSAQGISSKSSDQPVNVETDSANSQAADAADDDGLTQPYVQQWNRLVSTTNWEKGRIICAWRGARIKAGIPVTEYSDEAWATLVGGVTGQHVGRLRRAYEKFGTVWEEYPGLYWSHFQIALEWDDAEMWLEGAVQNSWSVSQMRAARWEAHGAPDSQKPGEGDIFVAKLEEDVAVSLDRNVTAPTTAAVLDPSEESRDGAELSDETSTQAPQRGSAPRSRPAGDAPQGNETRQPVRPFANLPELPDDVAAAFEQFKLVILTHKLAGWQEISRDDLIASLEALRELALLPADG